MINAADDIKDVGDARIFEFRAAVRDVEMFFLDDVVSYVRAIDERVAKAALAQTYLARSGLKESERGDLLDKWNGHERTTRRNTGSPNGPAARQDVVDARLLGSRRASPQVNEESRRSARRASSAP